MSTEEKMKLFLKMIDNNDCIENIIGIETTFVNVCILYA